MTTVVLVKLERSLRLLKVELVKRRPDKTVPGLQSYVVKSMFCMSQALSGAGVARSDKSRQV